MEKAKQNALANMRSVMNEFIDVKSVLCYILTAILGQSISKYLVHTWDYVIMFVVKTNDPR